MASVLALDVATVTGWAVGPIGAAAPATALEASAGITDPQPLSGTHRIGIKGTKDGAFFSAYEHWLRDLVAVHAPDYIVYEAPYISTDKHIKTARRLLGMAAITEMTAHQLGVKVFEANNATVRKHFCGKGNAPRGELKRMVQEECTRRGWVFTDDNEADALSLFDYAKACLVG